MSSANTGKFKYGKIIGGYGLATLLNQSVNLILIPVLWSTLSPEDFGVIAITQIVNLLLTPIYMFGVSETIQRYYFKWPDESRRHYLGWTLWFTFIFTLSLTLLLEILGPQLSENFIKQVPFDPIIRYTIWSTFLANFINIPVAISRIKEKILSYNILVNGSFITQIAIIYYLVKFENLGAYGYIKGILISNLIWIIPTLAMSLRDCAFFPDRKYIRIPLQYSGPLCFAGVLEGISNFLDRYFLDKNISLAAIGFYNIARQVSSPINVVNIVAKLFTYPMIHKHHTFKDNTDKMITRLGLVYAVFMTIPVIALTALAKEVVRALDPSGVYLPIVEYIPYFSIAFYINSLITIHGRGMDLKGSSKWAFLIPLFSASASLAVYAWAIPRYGVYGALFGFVTNYTVKTLITNLQAYHYFPRSYKFDKLIKSWLTAVVFFLLLKNINVEHHAASILADVLLILLFSCIQYYWIKPEANEVFAALKG